MLDQTMRVYFKQFLLKALPILFHERKNVLEIGAPPWITDIRHHASPESSWTALDPEMFLKPETLHELKVFDAVVLYPVLGQFSSLEPMLRQLWKHTTENVILVCRVTSAACEGALMPLLLGECPDEVYASSMTGSAAFKKLLDMGWLPNLLGAKIASINDESAHQALLTLAESCGIPRNTSNRFLLGESLILDCRKATIGWTPAEEGHGTESLSVVVPVNNETQFKHNLLQSPGLKEIGAQVIACRDMNSAAHAWEAGRKQAKHDWIVLSHQDVYYPKGSGFALLEELRKISVAERPYCRIGFAGLSEGKQGVPEKSGFVLDRVLRFDFPGTDRAISMDEFSIVLSKDSRFHPDPSLGWHLWATDLCLQGLTGEEKAYAKIVRLPLFHNSLGDGTLPESFHQSVRRLMEKYPKINTFPTLCGFFSR